MELPDELKKLYKHWEFHIENRSFSKQNSVFVDKNLETEVGWFVRERINIWKNKTGNKPQPYTEDAILQKYRFCNIFREFDRQTIEFHKILNPVRDDFPLWLLNMFYFRLVANTDTVKNIGLLSFAEKENETFYKKFINSPRPRFGVPYVFPVSVIFNSQYPTRELFIANYLPIIMERIASEIKTWKKISVYEAMKKIIPVFGYSLNFLWNEVLIDVAYQYPEYIDLFKTFPVGPGSIPTLTRINSSIEPQKLTEFLGNSDFKTNIFFEGRELRLSAENWEGIGCEFRKYTNLKQGKGRKRIYKTNKPEEISLF